MNRVMVWWRLDEPYTVAMKMIISIWIVLIIKINAVNHDDNDEE